jgi:hypothetical protein
LGKGIRSPQRLLGGFSWGLRAAEVSADGYTLKPTGIVALAGFLGTFLDLDFLLLALA